MMVGVAIIFGIVVFFTLGTTALGRHSYDEWLKADREAKERLSTT
jgi:hypothetical protein